MKPNAVPKYGEKSVFFELEDYEFYYNHKDYEFSVEEIESSGCEVEKLEKMVKEIIFEIDSNQVCRNDIETSLAREKNS